MVMDRISKNGATTPRILVSQKDAKLIESVHLILKAGNDVEIREARDGEPKVFEVTKKKFVQKN